MDVKDFDKLWDYSDPKKSEIAFRELLPAAASDPDCKWQLHTQIARAQGLQRKFDEAQATLNEVESKLSLVNPPTRVRYYLERGRVYNSSKEVAQAAPLFEKAYLLASEHRLDSYAIDALHMMAIVEKDFEKQLSLNLKAIDLAEKSTEPRAHKWQGSLYNNTGWTLHDAGRFEEAFALFQKALTLREAQGDADSIRVAKWCVARALRSLKKFSLALELQKALEEEHAINGTSSGYVFEELAELYLELAEPQLAKSFFAKAYTELAKDPWAVANEGKKLERLKKLS